MPSRPSAVPPDLLHLDQLRVTRGDTVILDGVDWRVARGQHWVVMGPNGSGKTTLLRVLAGFLSASGGTIRLLGRTFGTADWREVRRELGIVSAALAPAIPPGELALETVISGRYAMLDFWGRATSDDQHLARRLLAALDVPHLAARPWAHLSQGERQRVLIARALIARPRLLILDEPCAGLDPLARQRFLTTIETLARRRRGPGIILVTHHVEEITPAFTHLLLLAGGRVAAAGPLPRTLTTAALNRAFATPLRLRRTAASYRLDLTA